MAGTTRGRSVFANQPVLDQADFFQSDGFTRVGNLTITDIQAQLFFNNVLQTWVLTDGAGITDAQVSSGKVYFLELTSGSGIYSVRFRPNAIGYWRLILTYPVGSQVLGQDYDVIAQTGSIGGGLGLKSSFIKPGDRGPGL
jgi:hypothetical protein